MMCSVTLMYPSLINARLVADNESDNANVHHELHAQRGYGVIENLGRRSSN